jgi:hypothetical protein
MQENVYYIYRHIRPDKNEVFYIGIGKYQKKWKYNRAYHKTGRNNYWLNVVKNNPEYKIEIVLEDLTKEKCISKEIEFITLYGRKDISNGTLVNLTDGGEGVCNISNETRDKISTSRLGTKNPMYGKKITPERKQAMSLLMSGENNPNYGKKIPDWHKEINRKTQLGKKQSENQINHRIEFLKKKVIDLKNNITYDSIKDVALVFKKSPSHMTRLIKQNKFNLKFL